MRILNELENELIKVSFDIYALQLFIDILVDKHKVRVNLKSSIFSHDYTHLVALLCLFVDFGDRAILDQRWFLCKGRIDMDS